MKKLENCLQTMKSPTRLIQLISYGRRAYYKGDDQVPLTLVPSEYVNIVEHQNVIGCSNFVQGRVSKKFTFVVTNHYKEIKFNQKPSSWIKILISTVIDTHVESWKDRFNQIYSTDKDGIKNVKEDLLHAVNDHLSHEDTKLFGNIEAKFPNNDNTKHSFMDTNHQNADHNQ